MSGGNGKDIHDRVGHLESEVSRCSQRLHLVERDVCSHALEASQESRATREAVDALAAEFARFAASVAECINKLQPRKRRWLERWLG